MNIVELFAGQATCQACDWCDSESKHRAYMKGHEKRCLSNPEHRACQSCRWWLKNLPAFGRVPIQKARLAFCSHPDEDYSYVDAKYAEDCDSNQSMQLCDGWKAVAVHRRHHRKRFKRAGNPLAVHPDPAINPRFFFSGSYLPWAYMIHYGD